VIEKLATVRRPHDGRNSNAELADLTPRERDILGLMCQGLADQEIAGALEISRNTVRNYVALIYQKTGVHRRSAAIVWARDRGFTGATPRGTAVRGSAGVRRRSRDRRAG
jgi:DNA-binding CsgD family transcriptional regulator